MTATATATATATTITAPTLPSIGPSATVPLQAPGLVPGGLDPLTIPPWLGFLLAAGLVLVLPRRLGALAGVTLPALAVAWAVLAPAGVGPAVAPIGLDQVLVRVDPLSRAVVALFGFVAAANVWYGYATGADARQTVYSLVYMGAGVAAVAAGDWLTLLIAWELMAVASTVLVWHHGGDAVRPAFRYAVYHLAGGTFLVAGVALHYTATGSFAMVPEAGSAFGSGYGMATTVATALAVVGVGVNLGFVGIHAWLPDTYPRPHVAASVVLAGFTTKVAVYALARLVPLGDPTTIVVWMGAAMVLFGVIQAVFQSDVRRLLSYHIISQVGYMVVAVGLGTGAGLAGATAHLIAHVLYKGLLFMVAGAIIVRVGEASLKKLGVVAALAITGAPGFSGFVSKGLVIKAAETATGGQGPLWWVLVAGSVGTALSFAKFGYYAFVRPAPEGTRPDLGVDVDPAPAQRALSAVMVVVAVPIVVLGLAPQAFLGVMPGDPAGFEAYAGSELTKAIATLVGGIVVFVVVRGPIEGIRSVDVDDVAHPLAARTGAGASRLATRVGGAAARAGGRAARRLGDTAGRTPATPTPAVERALLVLTLTSAAVLLGALL
jgi:multicomponent Na+:H+ antiporter subunit D